MNAKKGRFDPPSDLQSDGREFWQKVTAEFDVQSDQLELLASACRQLDRACQCRQAIAEQGVAVKDRWGVPKPHPLLTEERAAHLAFLRLRRELGVDIATAPETARGPTSKAFK